MAGIGIRHEGRMPMLLKLYVLQKQGQCDSRHLLNTRVIPIFITLLIKSRLSVQSLFKLRYQRSGTTGREPR
jgi:hypothetical protein